MSEALMSRPRDAFDSARELLAEAPNTVYGTVLPLARDTETGAVRFALPGILRDTARGLVDLVEGPRTGTVTPEATAALVDVVGGRGLLSRRDPGQLNIMVGRGSQSPAHQRAIAEAESTLSRPDADPVSTFSQTGAYRGPDGMMRYEVPDTQAVVDYGELQKAFTGWDMSRLSDPSFRPPIYETSLGSILPHSELYGAYPGLATTPIQIVPGRERITPDGAYAVFEPPLAGPFSNPNDFGQIIAAGADPESLRRHLLHEVQHAIQTREGFFLGGSPDAPATTARAASMDEYYDGVADATNEGLARAAARIDRYVRSTLPPTASLQQVEDATQAFLATRPDITERLSQYETIAREFRTNPQDIRSRDQYVRIGGEAEARMVPNRAYMTEEGLRQTYPSESYDVSLDTLWDITSGLPAPWQGVPPARELHISPEIREPGIRFAKGGTMLDTHPPKGLLARQEDGALEELPPGSLPEEVRDDIDVKLSEGEFVIPADAVRWHGMKSLMALIDEAKEGFGDMAERGLIQRPGGSLLAEEADDEYEDGEPSEAEKAAELEKYGRHGDSLLAHINEEEAELLMARGGAGTRNPVTGLLEFWSENSVSDSNDPGAGQGTGHGGASGAPASGDAISQAIDAAIAAGQGPPAPQTVGIDDFGIESVPSYAPETEVDAGRATPGQRGAVALGRTAASIMGVPTALAGPLASAAVRGLETPDAVMSAVAAMNPVTAMGVAVTQGLAAMGINPMGPAETSQQSAASPNANAGGDIGPSVGLMSANAVGPQNMSPNQRFMSPLPYLYSDALGLLSASRFR